VVLDSLVANNLFLNVPKTGWNNFLNKILDYDILTLKDFRSIPGYFDATDLRMISVEIASDKYYEYYALPGAYIQPKNIIDARRIIEVLELIKKQFPQIPKE